MAADQDHLVEATFKANLSMVANNRLRGRRRNASGNACNRNHDDHQTCHNVECEQKVEQQGGKGKTNMPMIINTSAGIPRPE
jgi:hypothetical protein